MHARVTAKPSFRSGQCAFSQESAALQKPGFKSSPDSIQYKDREPAQFTYALESKNGKGFTPIE